MTARQHHFVPQCYLKGFVENRDKPKLFAVDFKNRTSFFPHPKNVAVERDFHRIDVEGHPPDALESAFGEFETDLDQALRRITERRCIADAHDRSYLFNLVGLMATKSPRVRKNITDFEERVFRSLIGIMTSTPEIWQSQIKKAREAGYIRDDIEVDYKKIRDFVEDGFDIEMPPQRSLALELETFDKILPYIFHRKWISYLAPPTASFITSDHPMCLMWSNPNKRNSPFPPGLGLKNTQLLFPVSSGLAIVGAFEFEQDDIIEASEDEVAEINGSVITNARHQVYGRDDNFPYFSMRHAAVRRGRQLLDDLLAPSQKRQGDYC